MQEKNSFKNKKLMRPDGWVIKKYLSEELNPDRWRKISRSTDANAIKIFKNKCSSSIENAGEESSTSWKVINTSPAKKWTVMNSKFKMKNEHNEFIKTKSTIKFNEEKEDKSVTIVDEKLNTDVTRLENFEITPLSIETSENFDKKQEDSKDKEFTLGKKEESSNSNISVESIKNKKIREMEESKEEKKTEDGNRKENSLVANPSSLAEENNIEKNIAVNNFFFAGYLRLRQVFCFVFQSFSKTIVFFRKKRSFLKTTHSF